MIVKIYRNTPSDLETLVVHYTDPEEDKPSKVIRNILLRAHEHSIDETDEDLTLKAQAQFDANTTVWKEEYRPDA